MSLFFPATASGDWVGLMNASGSFEIRLLGHRQAESYLHRIWRLCWCLICREWRWSWEPFWGLHAQWLRNGASSWVLLMRKEIDSEWRRVKMKWTTCSPGLALRRKEATSKRQCFPSTREKIGFEFCLFGSTYCSILSSPSAIKKTRAFNTPRMFFLFWSYRSICWKAYSTQRICLVCSLQMKFSYDLDTSRVGTMIMSGRPVHVLDLLGFLLTASHAAYSAQFVLGVL